MSAAGKAVFLSYASPAFANRRRCALARQEAMAGRQDAIPFGGDVQ